jgi:hypothetical protein
MEAVNRKMHLTKEGNCNSELIPLSLRVLVDKTLRQYVTMKTISRIYCNMLKGEPVVT